MNSHIEQIIVIITSIGTFSFALAYTIKRVQNLLYTMRGLKPWDKFVLIIKTGIKCTEWLKEHLANRNKLEKLEDTTTYNDQHSQNKSQHLKKT